LKDMNRQNILTSKTSAPWSRVVIIVVSLLALCLISYLLHGSIFPTKKEDALIFQNALLLIILGSALIEHKYTKPADSMVNGLIGAVTLFTVFGKAPLVAWWIVFLYCVAVSIMAGMCTAVSSGKGLTGRQEIIAKITYKPSIVLGKARVLYSVVFLFGLFTFYSTQSLEALVLIIFWGIFITLWPLGIPELLSGLKKGKLLLVSSGRVIRTEAPNIVRATIQSNTKWNSINLQLYQQSEGEQHYVVPLFSEELGDNIVGTGICAEKPRELIPGLANGFLYDINLEKTEEEIATLLGGGRGSQLLGFVVEGSSIEAIQFQTINPYCCKEGMTVWCKVNETPVYYQITEGTNKEETLEDNRHGFQIATAGQLGLLDQERGFTKYDWLPPMNAPVFGISENFGRDSTVREGDFSYGNIPGTLLKVGGAFVDMLEYHTAILGVTGSGKTELAFDLIRHAIGADTKVICVDLTQRYEGRLSDIHPKNLSLTAELANELGEKLFDVETGQYGAPDEKKALDEFSTQLRDDIEASVKEFIEDTGGESQLGIITLHEISNTKATIYVTELFLSCILHYARDNSENCPSILIVLEEAHTVVPEASTMGLGDFQSKGLVAKIAQIALQGRKYGVGLLVIAQRTATVSKTVLTQCNTIITFTCFDSTSLGFLGNVLGERHIRLIPNLPFLHAVVFGKGVRSERPIVVQVPFDKNKNDAQTA
jgi:hypothetical protein